MQEQPPPEEAEEEKKVEKTLQEISPERLKELAKILASVVEHRRYQKSGGLDH